MFILKSVAETQSSICNVFQLHTHTHTKCQFDVQIEVKCFTKCTY